MGERRLERGEQSLEGQEAVTHINGNIFNKGGDVNFVNYTMLGQLAKYGGKVKIDFASISDEQSVNQLADIVDKIFDKMRTKVDAINFTSGFPTPFSSLNDFLLKLAETGLNSAQLSAIKTKYDAKFGQHINLMDTKVDTSNVKDLERALGGKATNSDALTINAHQKIVKAAQKFATQFAEQITAKKGQEDVNAALNVKAKQNEIPDQSDERLNQELEVRNRVGEIWKESWKESLAALQDENDHLARNCLAKLWNKKTIEKNRLEIDNLDKKLWDSGSVASSEDREIRRQFGKEGVQISRDRGGQR